MAAVALAGLLAAGCVSRAGRAEPAAAAARQAEEPATVALDREVRYYRDSSGGLWDDRGRRVEPDVAPGGR